MTKRLPTPIVILLAGLAGARVVMVTWQAVDRTRGDFYASMPGAHVETLNPTLWNSPDMALAWGYQRDTYFRSLLESERYTSRMFSLPLTLMIIIGAVEIDGYLKRASVTVWQRGLALTVVTAVVLALMVRRERVAQRAPAHVP